MSMTWHPTPRGLTRSRRGSRRCRPIHDNTWRRGSTCSGACLARTRPAASSRAWSVPPRLLAGTNPRLHDEAFSSRSRTQRGGPAVQIQRRNEDLRAGLPARAPESGTMDQPPANRALLATLGERSDARFESLRNALDLELQMRPVRRSVDWRGRRWASRSRSPSRSSAAARYRPFPSALRPVAAAVEAVLACPRPDDAVAMAKEGTPEAFRQFKQGFDAALARHAARVRSRTALAALAAWFTDEWTAANEGRIARGESTQNALQGVVSALRTLELTNASACARRRSSHPYSRLPAVLRARETDLRQVPPTELEGFWAPLHPAEAFLAWKGGSRPPIQNCCSSGRRSSARYVARRGRPRDARPEPGTAAARHRPAPARHGSGMGRHHPPARAPHTRRLRELLDLGQGPRPTRLRPIWLMNPDVASRIPRCRRACSTS